MSKKSERFAKGSKSYYHMVVGTRRHQEYGTILVATPHRDILVDTLKSDLPNHWYQYDGFVHIEAGDELPIDMVANESTDWALFGDVEEFADQILAKLDGANETGATEPQEDENETDSDERTEGNKLSFDETKKLMDCLGPEWSIERTPSNCIEAHWNRSHLHHVMASKDFECDINVSLSEGIEEIGQFYIETARRLRSGEAWTFDSDPEWLKDLRCQG